MKKYLFALTLSALAASSLYAQTTYDNYVFKVKTGDTYTPLTAGTEIEPGLIWDEESFKFPMGITSKIGSTVVSDFSVHLASGLTGMTDTAGVLSAFGTFLGADLQDRGWLDELAAVSPLRYQLTGMAPNRIFKFEIANAGFFDEWALYGTQDDSVNIQVWVYETSNIVELRYGPSQITHPADYFYLGGTAPVIGYVKDLDFDSEVFTKAYFLTGTPSEPAVDSTDNIMGMSTVSSYPVSGTVYRFIPKDVAASIGEIEISKDFDVYPTASSSTVHVNYKGANKSTRASVMNLSGQVLQSQNLQQGRNDVNIVSLPAGYYFIEVSNNEGSAIFKIVKQ